MACIHIDQYTSNHRMTSQSSDILSRIDSESVEIPDSPVLNCSQLSPSVVTSTTNDNYENRRYSKVWLYALVGRNKVILNH
ncbi:hypothetical protein V1504DRAFT_463593 [Lipomyces starkeyi]